MLQDKKVFGWWGDFDGCAHYRIITPLRQLANASTGITTNQWWGSEMDRVLPNDWPDYDVIVGQRICQSDGNGGGPADQWTSMICTDRSVLSVYEIDDDLFSIPEDNPAFEFFTPEVQHNVKACAATADLVTVSTEPLRDVMIKYNPNVRVLPNFVPGYLLDIPRPSERQEVIIGWAGSATHGVDFKAIGQRLGLVMAMHNNTKFMTIGADYADGLPPGRIIRRRWFKSTRRAYPHIAQFDIGIAPLADNKFNESKSYIKVLEYAALGIPCIASPVGPYPDFIEHGVTGFLAKNPSEWMQYLDILIRDEDLRLSMGRNARAKAGRYTIEGNIHHWVNAYSS